MNLEEYVSSGVGITSEFEARTIFFGILDGLYYLHNKFSEPIVHRDIKPNNILIGESFRDVKLTDFGLSKDLEVSHAVQASRAVGTKSYVSPEMLHFWHVLEGAIKTNESGT